MVIPAGFSTNDNQQVVITYGETTSHTAEYKNIVDTFFKNQANVDMNSVNLNSDKICVLDLK